MATIDHEKFAKDALVVLVGRVLSPEVEDKRITYGDLAKSIGFPEPHRGNAFAGSIGETLGTMGKKIGVLDMRGTTPVPEIQSLVVKKGQKIPGPGFEYFHSGYQKLPLAEKRRVAEEYQEKVYAFSEKWRDVLNQLGISIETSIGYPDEVEDDPRIVEGAKKQVVVNRYERDPRAKILCAEKHGWFCSVCGFDFEQKYGDKGKKFIHVHHLKELSKIGKAYKVDPVRDLRPVCPNCHAMIHRKRERALTIEELKKIIADNRQ